MTEEQKFAGILERGGTLIVAPDVVPLLEAENVAPDQYTVSLYVPPGTMFAMAKGMDAVYDGATNAWNNTTQPANPLRG